jgi:hypothetical protein
VKCDEQRPGCSACRRLAKECIYAEEPTTPRRPRALSARESSDNTTAIAVASVLPPDGTVPPELPTVPANEFHDASVIGSSQTWLPFPVGQPGVSSDVLPDDQLLLDDSLFTFGDALTPSFGPFEWYDLLAEDAINSMQNQTHNNRWNFDIASLSRRQSPRQSPTLGPARGAFDHPGTQVDVPVIHKHWNTESNIELSPEELVYFEHFIGVVAPILDLFDPEKHFANVVPHLALRNVGLLKSLLAVGACHMVMFQPQAPVTEALSPVPPSTPASNSSASPTTSRIAEQYYYETLQYLSQNLLYQAYTTSHEMLATATMISTYEVSS